MPIYLLSLFTEFSIFSAKTFTETYLEMALYTTNGNGIDSSGFKNYPAEYMLAILSVL